jgi:hypothetical protein
VGWDVTEKQSSHHRQQHNSGHCDESSGTPTLPTTWWPYREGKRLFELVHHKASGALSHL